MREHRRASSSRAALACGLGAAAIALAVKLALALRTYGTTDVAYWELFLEGAQRLGGLALYRRTQLFADRFNEVFNHPPFMIHALRAMGALARGTGLPFPFWLRLPAILADLGTVALMWRLLGAARGPLALAGSLALLALAPPSILIAGFHGNTDPVMVFFVLLAVALLATDTRHAPWLAGAAFGMSMNIKVVPAVLVPAAFLYLPTARARLAFFGAAGGVLVGGSLPYLAQDPGAIVARIAGYGSFYGQWGVPRLLGLLPPGWAWLDALYARLGKILVLAAIVAVSWGMNRRERPPLFQQFGLVLALFLALAPGFGVQYLAWLIPWAVGINLWAGLAYYATSGVFLFLVYDFWAGGLPWYFADPGSREAGIWRGQIVAAEVACWAAVVLILLLYGRAVFARTAEPLRRGARTRR